MAGHAIRCRDQSSLGRWFLSFLDPKLNDVAFEIWPSDYAGDGPSFLKLAFNGSGEIDFIIAQTLMTPGVSSTQLFQSSRLRMTPNLLPASTALNEAACSIRVPHYSSGSRPMTACRCVLLPGASGSI